MTKKLSNANEQPESCEEYMELLKQTAHQKFNQEFAPKYKDRLERGEEVEFKCRGHKGHPYKGIVSSMGQAELFYCMAAFDMQYALLNEMNPFSDAEHFLFVNEFCKVVDPKDWAALSLRNDLYTTFVSLSVPMSDEVLEILGNKPIIFEVA